MKKILAALAVTTALSSVAFAGAEDTFYLKAAVGANMLSQTKDGASGLKLKSKTGFFADFGVGYNIMDNVRADLNITYLANPELKKSGKGTQGDKTTVKRKASIVALVPYVYVDLFDVSIAKFFVGAGVGLSQVNDKLVVSYPDYPQYNGTYKGKKKTNVAWGLALGASAEVSPGVDADFTYSYRDFGKAKKSKTLDKVISYKGHFISAGIRFGL